MSSLFSGLKSLLGESGAGPRQGYLSPTEEGYQFVPESELRYRTRQAKGYAQRGQVYAASVPGMTVSSILDSLLHNSVLLGGLVGAGLGLGLAFALDTSVDAAVAYMVVFAIVGVAAVAVVPKLLKMLPMLLI